MAQYFPCSSTVAQGTRWVWFVSWLKNSLAAPLWHMVLRVWYVSWLKNSLEAPLWHKKWVCLFKKLKNSHVAPWWKTLARSYWIDLQFTVVKDDSYA